MLYRVRWKNYCSDDDTWEPEAHLEDCREVLVTFKKKMQEAKAKKESESKKTMVSLMLVNEDTKQTIFTIYNLSIWQTLLTHNLPLGSSKGLIAPASRFLQFSPFLRSPYLFRSIRNVPSIHSAIVPHTPPSHQRAQASIIE